MKDFVYNGQPARVIFGAGSLKHLAREIETLGARKALVLSTPEQRASAEMIAGRPRRRRLRPGCDACTDRNSA